MILRPSSSTARDLHSSGWGPDAKRGRIAKRSARWPLGWALLLIILASALATACLSGGATPGAADPAQALDAGAREAARERRIEALKAEIERDRRQLAELVADPTIQDERALHENPTLRELAARITERADELERLEAGLDGGAAAP